jgi:hypothetical protein
MVQLDLVVAFVKEKAVILLRGRNWNDDKENLLVDYMAAHQCNANLNNTRAAVKAELKRVRSMPAHTLSSPDRADGMDDNAFINSQSQSTEPYFPIAHSFSPILISLKFQ